MFMENTYQTNYVSGYSTYIIVWQGQEMGYFSRGRCYYLFMLLFISPMTEIVFPHEPHVLFFICVHRSVSGCASDAPGTFDDFQFPIRHYGDSHFTARWTEKSRFPTRQTSSKTISFRCRRDKNYIFKNQPIYDVHA